MKHGVVFIVGQMFKRLMTIFKIKFLQKYTITRNLEKWQKYSNGSIDNKDDSTFKEN